MLCEKNVILQYNSVEEKEEYRYDATEGGISAI